MPRHAAAEDDAAAARELKRESPADRFRVFPQMKRSPALASLSRDHHHALVVARVLGSVSPDAAEVEAAAARFVQFLAVHEPAHFALEEAVLLPALGADVRGRALGERMQEDHAYLRFAAARLSDPLQPVGAEYLQQLGARLRAHVQMEERELFPYLEESLDPASLEEIGSRLAQAG